MNNLARLIPLVLALSQTTAAISQPNSTPGSSSGLASSDLQLSRPTATFQSRALEELQRRARALAGNDDAKFTALLRQGLARLPRALDQSDRGIGGLANTVTSSLASSVQPNDADRDPRFQSVVLRTVMQSRALGTRMVGSADVPPGSHPETVALVQASDQSLCTGVLIAPGAILTAAHCVCELGLANIRTRVAFGTDVKSPDATVYTIPDKTRIFPSTGAEPPSSYCADYKRFAIGGRGRVCDRDVALVQFNPADTPGGTNLPQFAAQSDLDTAYNRINSHDNAQLLPVQVVGYGVTRIIEGSGFYRYGSDGRKRYGVFTFYFGCPGVPPYDCAIDNGAYCMGGSEIVIQDLQYRITDSCAGDSGGPAFVMTTDGQWRLAGLVSRSLRFDSDCGAGGVYSAIYLNDIVGWLAKLNIGVAR